MAIENARLYEPSTRWLHQLETLNEIGVALPSEIELEPLLARVHPTGSDREHRQHAEASHVSIPLTLKDRSVTVIVDDDGRGFDPDSTGEDVPGLVGMRERVVLAGGLRIESRDGAGTTIAAEGLVL